MSTQHKVLPGDGTMPSYKMQFGKTQVVVNRPELTEKEKELRLKALYRAIAECLKK